MKKMFCFVLAAVAAFTLNISALNSLEKSFLTPPDATKPYMYWYWLNNNASARGITKDLKAMKEAGVGEVFIGHVVSSGIPEGNVPVLSPEWWKLVSFAVTEGDRIGVRVGMFNGPGWSQSGGPWMKPEQSMRYIASKETRVKGGTQFNGHLAKVVNALQDVAVIAYPVPSADGIIIRPAMTTTSTKNKKVEELALNGTASVKLDNKPLSIEFTFDKPTQFQTLTLDFGDSKTKIEGTIENISKGKTVKLRDFKIFRTNLGDAMGPMVKAPFDLSFTPTMSDKIRVTFTKLDVPPTLHDITLSPAARIDFGAEKQLGRMYPEPVPPVEAFVWPAMPENTPGTEIDPEKMIILTDKMNAEGMLSWEAPESNDWIIERFNMVSTGKMCGPTPPQATGLECDKMSRAAVDIHFDGMIGEFLRRIPAENRKGFQHITLDSYEVGPQNWTDDMTDIFIEKYGYDPIPWLAVVNGRVVGSRQQSDRFLWDWRRLVADLIAKNYVGGLKAVANRHGLKTWLENYGHWGFPGESLQYGGASDDIGGEYWLWNSLGDVECRLASSTAHVYGKKVVSAEAFTSNQSFVQTPANIKTRGDWCMTEGINHFVLHVYTHQPYDAVPGIVPWFGTDFNRNSTWFRDYGKGWTDYLRRCCHLLQQGTHAADVAYFFGEDTPRMNGLKEPGLPQGYDYDYINAEVLLTRAKCKNGRIVLPDGQSYRVLVLPPCDTMTPELLKQIRTFVKQGLTLLGNPPLRSPGMKNYPACDDAIKEFSSDLWGDKPEAKIDRTFGKGRVFRGHSLNEVFAKLDISKDLQCNSPDILWTHRTSKACDIYFISNQSEENAIKIAPTFRINDRVPELWRAENGTWIKPATYEIVEQGIRLPIELGATESTFVVFRKPLSKAPSITKLMYNGKTIVTCAEEKRALTAEAEYNEFTMTGFVATDKEITLPSMSATGVKNADQNFAVMPAHGNRWGDGHSGAGFSVGRNGVVVFEHWANNLPPVLVWRAPKPLSAAHIAVVYSNGKSQLYINGEHVQSGVASGQKVHATTQATPSQFSGEIANFKTTSTALSANAIAACYKRGYGSEQIKITPSVTFDQSDSLILNVAKPGRYTAALSNGTSKEWNISSVPRVHNLNGCKWEVSFAQQQGMTCRVEWDKLIDWKDSENPIIKYFSGTAVYTTSFEWRNATENTRVWLDLGKVKEIALVRLNGEKMGVLWHPPYRVDVSKALIKGNNTLEIRVANQWFNRFIGDEQLPDDTGADKNGTITKWPEWVLQNKMRPEKGRVTLTNRKNARKDSPLHSSGLLGDLLLIPEKVVREEVR
ncbi:MAG: glycosyl hydrolase [Kiritimatiellae bacterium]|nr:glycosyl hydrolase [Kiritimatiellia bacterium]